MALFLEKQGVGCHYSYGRIMEVFPVLGLG